MKKKKTPAPAPVKEYKIKLLKRGTQVLILDAEEVDQLVGVIEDRDEEVFPRYVIARGSSRFSVWAGSVVPYSKEVHSGQLRILLSRRLQEYRSAYSDSSSKLVKQLLEAGKNHLLGRIEDEIAKLGAPFTTLVSEGLI